MYGPGVLSPEPEWHGVLRDPDVLKPEAVAQANALLDAAKAGRWSTVVDILSGTAWPDKPLWWDVNTWRPGASREYAPLHQAAWHGAPVDVVEKLLELGAWRRLRTADGETALDIARRKGHGHLVEVLTPSRCPAAPEVFPALDRHLAELVRSRMREGSIDVALRFPQTEVLGDLERGQRLWFPIPGMSGGFAIELMRSYLFVESWSRVAGGSGQAHVVTTEGSVLVERGFV